MPLLAAASGQILSSGLTAWDGIRAGIIIAVALALSQVVRRLVVRTFSGEGEAYVPRVVGRVLAYVVILAGLVYALLAVKVAIGPLVGALGIGGIALAFALQDILQNLVAGIIIHTRRPIRHGDQVQLGNHTGIVRDIDLRTVLLRTFDGLDVYVPNRTVLENPLVNFTISPNRRLTLAVGVGYGSDLALVQRTLVDVARSVPGVLADPAPAAWVTGFGPSSIDFSVLVWFEVSASNLFEVQSDLAMAIKGALDGAGIEIPFPQRTVSLAPGVAEALAPASSDHAASPD